MQMTIRLLVALATLVSAPALADYVIAPRGGDITGAALSARLAQGDVMLTAASGDVVVNDAVSWSAHTLTLAAPTGSIKVNTVMAAAGTASLVLQTVDADRSGGVDMALSGNASTGNAFLGRVDFTGSAQTYRVNGRNYTLIHDIAELEAIRSIVALEEAYALAADVDWSGAVDPTWLGSLNTTAQFDGLGHVVRNLSGPGLFFVSVGTVRNLGLQGGATSRSPLIEDNDGVIANVYSTVTVVVEGVGPGAVGGLIGSNLEFLRNAWASGSVSGTNYVGGLVGFAERDTIQNSWASGNVTSSGGCSGGLVGGGSHGVVVNIRNAYATGNVTGGGTGGGLVGCLFAGNVLQNVWASGSVTGNVAAGALVGWNNSGGVSNGYYLSDTPGTHPANGIGTPMTLANLVATLPPGFDPAIWDNQNGRSTPYLKAMPGVIHVRDEGATPASAMIYTPVSTPAQLQAIRSHLDGAFALIGDIEGGAAGNFLPIGNSGTPFAGRFDGLGHVVQSLTISFPGNYAGLFGAVGTSGVVRNVGVSDGSVSGVAYTGALAGLNHGSISNAWASARVISGGYSVGGLVGENRGSIGTAYATGEVSGFAEVGGLVGYNNGNTASIAKVWASGSVTGPGSHIGGLAGFNREGYIGDAYWDAFSTGQSSAGENASGVFGASAVTSDPAQSAAANYAFKEAAYAGLGSFGSTAGSATWTMVDGSTRPFLQDEWQPVISNAHQLQLIRLAPDADYVLGSPTWRSAIDAAETGCFDGTAGHAGGMWAQAGFVPVGDAATAFSGNLDGQGHAIDALALNRPDAANAGLFGVIGLGATVRDLALAAPDIDGGNVNGANFGALAGTSHGSIDGVFVIGADVAGTGHYQGYAGGLVGLNNGIVERSFVTGSVTSTYAGATGGLLGRNAGSVSGSWASASVTTQDGYGSATGVLVGGNAGTIADSYASGSASGYYAGGLVGSHQGAGAGISRSYALSTVQASYSSGAGGLVGSAGAGATIADSFWNTDIVATGVGQGGAAGASGLPTLEWLTQGPAASGLWDFAGMWVEGYPYPVLRQLPHMLVQAQNPLVLQGVQSVTVDSHLVVDQYGNDAGTQVGGTPSWFADPDLPIGAMAHVGGMGMTALDPRYQLTYVGHGEVLRRTYQLTFDPNGGYGGPVAMSGDYASTLSLPDAVPGRLGHSFVEWNTAADGSGIFYAPGDAFVVPLADTTLYAQWEILTYRVTTNFGPHGSVALVDPVGTDLSAVPWGTVLTFAATPHSGYELYDLDGCGGSPEHSSPFSTLPITANCKLWARFVAIGAPQTDVGVSISDGRLDAMPGDYVAYAVRAVNPGDMDIVGAHLEVELPSALPEVEWACDEASTKENLCEPSSGGAGDLPVTVRLPPQGAVSLLLGGTLGYFNPTVTVSARIDITPDIHDDDRANNRDSDTDILTDLVIFRDGFESQ